MDMNFWVLEEIVKLNKEEIERELKFKETYKLYSKYHKKTFCVDLKKFIKFCI
jgi:hypothetical protein